MKKKHPNLNDGVLIVLKKPMSRFFYPRCPECGGLMVIRQTKIGSLRFYGCAHFPECKGIIWIDQPVKRSSIISFFEEVGEDDGWWDNMGDQW